MCKRYIDRKVGSRWENVPIPNESEVEVLHALAADLAAKYIGKAPYIRRICRRNNYDGTQTYTAYYDNGVRITYITDIY